MTKGDQPTRLTLAQMSMMRDQLSEIRFFIRAAQTGSFSRAAREMRISQPTGSRMVARLERRLGAPLLVRTTRSLSLTEAGAAFLRQASAALEALDAAEQSINSDGLLRGVLRVAVSSISASRLVIPSLPGFLALHPGLTVELAIDDRRQDLVVEGVDVAIRFGELSASSSRARRLGIWRIMIAAAPAYLRQRDPPAHPADLGEHNFIVMGPSAQRGLVFKKDGQEISVQMNGNAVIDSMEVAIDAGLAAIGIVVATSSSLAPEIDRGELVQLLPDWDLGSIEAHAVYAGGQAPKPAARAFVAHLVEALAQTPHELA